MKRWQIIKRIKDHELTYVFLSSQEHQKGLVYLQIIKRIREKGVSFKEDERIRVTKLLGTKITPQKKKELEDRLNILLSFRDVSEEQGTNDKLEL